MARQKRRKRRYGTPQVHKDILQKAQTDFQPQLQTVEQSWAVRNQESESLQEEEEILNEDESLDLEEQLEIERMKNEEARQTITSLIQDITSYKALIEEEKNVLESELCAERNKSQNLEDKVAELSEALLQTMQEHEEKLNILEQERTQRSSEMVGNLQLLIKELTYIEERNEELQQQLEAEKKNNREMQTQLLQAKDIIEKLQSKVSHLEGEKDSLLRSCTEQGASVPSDMFIQTEKQKLKLQAELQATKDDKANVFQLLEKERMKTQRISSLVQQIVSVAESPSVQPEPVPQSQKVLEELRKDLHKLGEEYKDTKRHILNDTTSVKDAIDRLKSEITTLKSSARWMPHDVEHKVEIPAAKRTVSFSKLPPRTNLIHEHVSPSSSPTSSSPSKEDKDDTSSKYPLKSFSLPRFHKEQENAIKENKHDEKNEPAQKQLNSKTESLSRIDLIRNLQAPYASNIERIQRRLSTTKALAPVGWEVTSDQQGLIYRNKITGQASRKHPSEIESTSSFSSHNHNRTSKRNSLRRSVELEEEEESDEEEEVEQKNVKSKQDLKLGLWIVVALPLSIIIHNLIKKLLMANKKAIKHREED